MSTNTAHEPNAPARYDAPQPRERGRSMDHIRDDVSHLSRDVAGAAAEGAHTGLSAVQHGAETTLEAGRKAAETLGDAHKAVCRHVSEHPASSILIAMGVGALISRLLPRR